MRWQGKTLCEASSRPAGLLGFRTAKLHSCCSRQADTNTARHARLQSKGAKPSMRAGQAPPEGVLHRRVLVRVDDCGQVAAALRQHVPPGRQEEGGRGWRRVRTLLLLAAFQDERAQAGGRAPPLQQRKDRPLPSGAGTPQCTQRAGAHIWDIEVRTCR